MLRRKLINSDSTSTSCFSLVLGFGSPLFSTLYFSKALCFFFFGPPLENITIAWYSVFTCISLGFFLSFLSFFLLKKKRNFCLYLYAYVIFSGNEDVWSLMLSCYFHVVIHNLLFILRWELPRSFFTPWWPWEDVFPLSRTW